MKISRNWLQKYFNTTLPDTAELANALTFHAFEIEDIEGDMFDVKVLPNRAADCLSHRGIAKELSAILNIPLTYDPLRSPFQGSTLESKVEPWNGLDVHIEDAKKCSRYMGAFVRGVKVGPSPAWLREALEAVGQRSINNVVDATNYVMLNIGQPLHAFDAGRISKKEGRYSIIVRGAKEGEHIMTLSGEELVLPKEALLIVDAHASTPIGIAGIKGGKVAEITEATRDLIIEAANFDGTSVRKTAQALKLFTEAGVRFQNKPSPELVAYGMRDVLALLTEIAGGEVVGVVDEYSPRASAVSEVSASVREINDVLGSSFNTGQIESVFKRLGLETKINNDVYTVTPSFERTDLCIKEDLAEEVGRILGYDTIASMELPPLAENPDQRRFRGIERMKDELVEQGFIEISTQSFVKNGDVELANPLDKTKPALLTSLEENLQEALTRAMQYASLVLPPNAKMKLFEVGSVFPKEGEYLELRMTERVSAWGDSAGTSDNLSIAKLEEYGQDYAPVQYTLSPYRPFSVYPCMTRDIALWVPKHIDELSVQQNIREKAGTLLARIDQFDRFEKEGRVSLAFRLVFQSYDRTLTDDEIGVIMNQITQFLADSGYAVR